MPFPQLFGDLGALATRGMKLPGVKVNARTPPFMPSNAGAGTALPPVPDGSMPDSPDDSQAGSGIGSNPPISPTLKQPPMTPGMRQEQILLDNPPAAAGGVRGKIGGVLNAIGWNWAGNPLKYPGLDTYQANLARAQAKAGLEDEATKRQEAQARIANMQANTQAMTDYRQQSGQDRQQNTYDRRMGEINKAGGFEAPNVPPTADMQDVPADTNQPLSPTNLPQRNLILSPGLQPKQSSSLGTVQSLTDPSTGTTTPMVTPNLKTRAEMQRVDAPQDILDFYKNLPQEFTKTYPVGMPNIGPDGKVAPEEAKRLEQKYQRDSAALQAWNTQRSKPTSSAQNKEQFQTTLAKVAAENKLPANALSDVGRLSNAIRSSATLTPEEKNNALAYLAANTTPAATGTAATIRVEGMGNIRLSPVLDTKNGNAPTLMSANDLNEANRQEPGRYIPAGPGAQALNKTALLEDIRGSIHQTRDSLSRIPEFSAGDKAKIAMAMRDRDPRSAISQLIGSAAGSSLTPDQQDYLINLAQLHEQAMAMRSVLGAGQSSDDLRAAIMRTIPGPSTPNKAYAAKQLDMFEATLNRLSRGVPSVPLRNTGGGQTFDVTDPTGAVHHFPSQQAANQFKQAAGIK